MNGVYMVDILIPKGDKEGEDKEREETVTPGKNKFATGFMGACTKGGQACEKGFSRLGEEML